MNANEACPLCKPLGTYTTVVKRADGTAKEMDFKLYVCTQALAAMGGRLYVRWGEEDNAVSSIVVAIARKMSTTDLEGLSFGPVFAEGLRRIDNGG